MKILTGRLVELAKSLSRASNTLPLEMDAGVKIALVMEPLRLAVQEREKRRQQNLLKYGELNEDGSLKVDKDNSTVFPVGGQRRFEAAMMLIDEEMVEFPCDPLPLTIFTHRASGKKYKDKDGEPITLLPAIISGLMPVLDLTSKKKSKKKKEESGGDPK